MVNIMVTHAESDYNNHKSVHAIVSTAIVFPLVVYLEALQMGFTSTHTHTYTIDKI